MAEKEPKVAPIIRLPQIRAERGTSAGKPPGLFSESGKNGPGAVDDQDEEEELWEDEAARSPLKSQISGDQTRLSGETQAGGAGISSLLRRALLNFAEQERQRTRLITILLAAQAALLLAVLPGYVFDHFQLAGVLVTLGGLAFFGITWLLNWMGRSAEASFLLVVGGGALVVLDMLLSAAHLVSLDTLHISLRFLLVILSGGILFSPETALILSIISGLFTAAVALLFHPSGPLAALFNAQGRYVPLVYLVLVQPAVGVVAWLFGRQMQESVHLITYVSGLQMSNKRLHKRLRETAEKKRHLEAGIALIQQTHARVAAGDYSARAHVEGDLLPLAVSLNLMLERVESFVHGEHERERMETAVAGLAELAGRVGQNSLGRLPVPTGTALDGLSIAIKQMQTNVNQRLARVQQSAAALMTTVSRCQDGLLPVAEVLEEHLRNIDALVIAADTIMNSAQRQLDFATRAEHLLLAAAPPGVDLKPIEENRLRKGTSALLLAEEMERRAALAGQVEVFPAAPQAALAAPEGALAEPEAVLAAESAASLDEMPGGEQTPQPAEQTMPSSADAAEATAQEAPAAVEEPTSEEPEETGKSAAKESEEAGESAGQEDEAPSSAAAEPVEQGEAEKLETLEAVEEVEAEPARDVAVVPVAGSDRWLTLADVDREAAEEARVQEPDWDLWQLRELMRVLVSMGVEAGQQERNARTLTFKLRSMVQGMPNTRRVDMMAGWLRVALEAVAQSAAQVQQVSSLMPTSAFQPTKGERADQQPDQ